MPKPPYTSRVLTGLTTFLLFLLLITGCSGVRIAYNTADFLIEHYADDYLSLDSAQMTSWAPTLDAALDRHREQELPYLAAFFDSAMRDARKGFRRADVDCLWQQFETIYKRHFRLAAETAAPLLASLSSDQITSLQREFAKEARDDATDDDPASVARRERKRAERYEDNMRWWIGDLTNDQRGIVADVTRSMPDTAGAWYDYRNRKRAQLIALLRRGADADRIERFLTDWLVDYRDMPASLQSARPELRRRFGDLIVRLDASFSSEQRDQLIRRLTRLRDDFKALQRKRPAQVAPVGC
jgi:hypothetical protein